MAKTQQDAIKDFIYSLDHTDKSGKEALDEAIQYCSRYTYSLPLSAHFEYGSVYNGIVDAIMSFSIKKIRKGSPDFNRGRNCTPRILIFHFEYWF